MKIKYKFSSLISLASIRRSGHLSSQKGFTLIELLIVIAILGVLAAGILVAIDPVDKIAQTEDSARKSHIHSLGLGASDYYISQNAYPPQSATWVSSMQQVGAIKAIPKNPSYSSLLGDPGVVGNGGCTTSAANQEGYCYRTGVVSGNTEAVVFAQLESKSARNKCSGSVVWFIWFSERGQAGIICLGMGGFPQPGLTQSFVD